MVARANDVAAALLTEVGPMSTMKLQKLLYFAQAWNLAITDEPLFDAPVEAWPQGPVVREVWKARAGRRMVEDWADGDPTRLAEQERALVHLIRLAYGDLSGDDLSELTHQHRPWLEAREGLREKEPSNRPLDPTTMAEFYRRRRLVGRTAADLASGGLLPPAREHPSDTQGLHEQFSEIRESFRGAPKEQPADYPYREHTSGLHRYATSKPFHTTLPKAERGGPRPKR